MSFDSFITTSKFRSAIPYLKVLGKMCFRIQNLFSSWKGIDAQVPYLTLPVRSGVAPIIKHINISAVKGINIPTKWGE